MQRTILIILSFFFSINLFSQKAIDTNWGNGTLKTRVKLDGKDTVYVELRGENGDLFYQRWGNDSIFTYRKNLPNSKVFYKKGQKFVFKSNAFENSADSVVSYNLQGQLSHIHIKKGENDYSNYTFRDNRLFETQKSEKITKSISKITTKDAFGRVKQISITDTSKANVTIVDSIFFSNGQLWLYSLKTNFFQIDEGTLYDSLGKLQLTYKRDTNTLKIVKDNSECLYGLQNNKEEWLIKPQFESLEAFYEDSYLACGYGKCSVLDKNGKPLFPAQWDFLEKLSRGSYTKSKTTGDYNFNTGVDDYNSNVNYDVKRFTDIASSNSYLSISYIKCRKGDKYGVIDGTGKVIIEPKYENIRQCVDDFYEVQINKKWGVVNTKGDIVVNPNYYEVHFTTTPQYFVVADTFPSYYSYYDRSVELKGLVDAQGNELLPIKYDIGFNDSLKNLFYIQTKGEISGLIGFGSDFENTKIGMYDADKKSWVLDTIYKISENSNRSSKDFSALQKTNPKNDTILGTGIVDKVGNVILPFEYDNVTFYWVKEQSLTYDSNAKEKNALFIAQKGDKYGLFDASAHAWLIPLQYDYLQPIIIYSNNENYQIRKKLDSANETDILNLSNTLSSQFYCLAAKKGNQWTLINEKNQKLLNDSYDYIAAVGNFSYVSFLVLTQKEKALILSKNSFPLYSTLSEVSNLKNDSKLINLQEIERGNVIINNTAKVLMTPQYKTLFQSPEYIIAIDTLLKKQKIIYTDGSIKDFLPQYHVLNAQIEKDFAIVEDPKSKLLGTVTTTGIPLIPCAYFAISAPNENDIVWVKQQAPNISPDSILNINDGFITALDSAWLMFNRKGKQVSKSTFKYPFLFHKGVGAGMMNEKFGIWQNDGKMLLPPQYDRIILDTTEQIFYLFKRWADSSLAIGFADMKGRVIQEPRLDKMSTFFGNYAVGFTGGHHVVVNKKGEYIVPPFANSFLNYKGSIHDSLWLVNLPKLKLLKESRKKFNIELEDEYDDDSYNVNNNLNFSAIFDNAMHKKIDSLELSQKNQLLNFIIEKTGSVYYIFPEIKYFQRSNEPLHITSSFENFVSQGYGYTGYPALNGDMDVELNTNLSGRGMNKILTNYELRKLEKFYVSNKYISVILSGEQDSIKKKLPHSNIVYDYLSQKISSYNIVKDDNGWQNIELRDILNITRDNSLLINELFIQKIKQLKNEDIDCSNPTIYFEKSKELYSVKQEGIEFYLPRHFAEDELYQNWNHIPLLLTWEELKPFTKK